VNGRVFVAGAGVISAIGNSLPETLRSFELQQSGIGYSRYLETRHQQVLPVGEVKLSNDDLRERIGVEKQWTRTALLGIHAATEAVRNSGIRNLKKWRTGLISATTVGGMDQTEEFFSTFLKDPSGGDLHQVENHACGKSTESIADALGVNAFLSTINTACSSSVNSIMFGSRLISQGMLDIVVAGGTDALSRFTLNGFNSLMILDNEPCRPFDAGRKGLNLGEGAGYLVLISWRVAREEGISPEVVVSGYANTNDAFHQTASSPEGRGSFAAMQLAMKMAGLTNGDIDYINVHGTGTVNNDQSEGTAIRRLFGNQVPKISSTKSFTGHTLGACGGIEAAFSILSLQSGCLFPNLRFQNPMPDIDLEPLLLFERGVEMRHVMSNSFGFGGNCSSIIFSKVQE
jgi:3-oxoacyl-(acyl-carrier-protein) synthase